MEGQEQEEELSVASAYCVVYTLNEDDWKIEGDGWCHIHLFRDINDNSHRIVGWTCNTPKEVVINSNVTPKAHYKLKSEDFHRYTDEEQNVYGFAFYKKEDLSVAELFMKAVQDVINFDGGQPRPDDPPPVPSRENFNRRTSLASPTEPTALASQYPSPEVIEAIEAENNAIFATKADLDRLSATLLAEQEATYSTADKSQSTTSYLDRTRLGAMKILQPKLARAQNALKDLGPKSKRGLSWLGPKKQDKFMDIGDPFNVMHLEHVHYDQDKRKYEGLPESWQPVINKQFEVDPSELPMVNLPQYPHAIPQVLHQMKEYLLQHDALREEGIFRKQADSQETAVVKQELNTGKFVSCEDIHCVALLIKVWFRILPTSLLQGIPQDQIANCRTKEEAGVAVTQLEEPWHSIFLWLLDLCVEVCLLTADNRMNSQNLGIVIGPNLFTPSFSDPREMMQFTQKVASFLDQAIQWRRATRNF